MSKLWFSSSHIPSVTLYEIDRLTILKKIEDAWPLWIYIKLDDHKYFYVSWEDWGKIFDNVQSSLPSYKDDTLRSLTNAPYYRQSCREH